MIRFKRYADHPVIPRTPGTFYSQYSANPDLIVFKDKVLLFFRGQGDDRHDQIGVAYQSLDAFDGMNWNDLPDHPVIRVSPHADAFDSNHILDPAVIELDGKLYVYYTAHSMDGVASTGLALSDDGLHFEKLADPIMDALAPEAVYHGNLVYLFYQRIAEGGHFEIFCCPSEDGIHFDKKQENVVFKPSGQEGAFDSFSISTIRIWKENDWFYMTYGGCDRYADYPSAFGLARSRDLLEWERYPCNPVFSRGTPGEWDEGAIWFPVLYKVGEKVFLWYEGAGSGKGLDTAEAQAASRLCREENYGGYGVTTYSQIGLAIYDGDITDWGA